MTEAVIRYDDAGALVSIYDGGVMSDRYYVHDEDGDPRRGIAKDVRVIEHDHR